MRKFDADFDLDRDTDEADPRELFEMSAVRDFKAACGDLLRAGFVESDLAALIEESLPIAEEIDESAPAVAPPF
jgi:hypothetical protein